jgi:hypothetical protein
MIVQPRPTSRRCAATVQQRSKSEGADEASEGGKWPPTLEHGEHHDVLELLEPDVELILREPESAMVATSSMVRLIKRPPLFSGAKEERCQTPAPLRNEGSILLS